MKTTKMYEIRKGNGKSHSTRMSSKLRSYARAKKLVSRLRKMGFDAFAAPLKVAA
jgi:cell division septation protein DedD